MKNNEYLFEVYKDKKRVFWTECEECSPDEETIKLLKKSGYRVKEKKGDNRHSKV